MTGLLDGNGISELFGDVLADIYGDGELIRTTNERQPGGVFLPVEQPPIPIKVQIDRCTESMRQAQGYTETDVRMLILQTSAPGPTITSNDRIIARGETWKIYEVYEDPARSYWAGRAVRQATDV